MRSTLTQKFNQDCRRAKIARRRSVLLAPIAIMLLLAMLLIVPLTSPAAQWLLDENHPVELLTFLLALAAAFAGLKFAQQQAKKGSKWLALFYLLFSLFFFFFAMEEISWGQQFLQFDTPEFWRIRNAQDELTLHNYDHPAVQYLEAYPLLAGIVGLVGIGANITNKLPKLICPPLILFSWFTVIALHSGIDLFHEFYIFSPTLDETVNHLDEAAEMLVAMSGLLFVQFNARRL